jgi:hypothetical protein
VIHPGFRYVIHPVAAGPIVFWPVDASTTGKRLAALGLVLSGFVRFVVAERDPGTGLELGIFQAAYRLRDRPDVPDIDRAVLRDTSMCPHDGPRRHAQMLGVVATLVLALACNQATSVERGEPTVTANTFKVDDLHITADDSGLMFQYRTSSSSTDCKAQAADAPKVWDLVVRPRLNDSHVQRVILFPEDQSGTSVSFEFTKSASGQWSAAAPCSIAIRNGLAP